MTQRLTPATRKAEILEAAIGVATRDGFGAMTREAVAAHGKVSPALVSHHHGTMRNLRRAVMRAAIARKLLPIVADGLAIRDPQACRAPDGLKQKSILARSK